MEQVRTRPGVVAATAAFQYGTSTAYGSSVPAGGVSTGAAVQSLAAALSDLSPSTTYHYRLVVSDVDATAYGNDQTFTTSAAAAVTVAPELLAPATARTPSAPAPCRSLRMFIVHLFGLASRPRATLHGHRLSVRGHSRHYTAHLNLTGLPRATYTLRLSGTNAHGHRVRATSHYRTCTPSGP